MAFSWFIYERMGLVYVVVLTDGKCFVLELDLLDFLSGIQPFLESESLSN